MRMQGLLALKERFDVAFACDTDHDRHGIVTKITVFSLLITTSLRRFSISFTNRPHWPHKGAVGKTVVSSQMIDRVVAKLDEKHL